MKTIELVRIPIQLSQWTTYLGDVDAGAQLWFSGVTRRKTIEESGREVFTRTLYYDAYLSMAVRQLNLLVEGAFEQFALRDLVLVHRLGEVPLGDISVLVGCSSAHRVDVFEAIPWIMDRLKSEVPIWKRETFEDASTHWVHP
ncbi:MAG: molybdenum cofactor biosynthesis protein MoaE [Planctomycetota bacterium]